jgi:hypothetical protein
MFPLNQINNSLTLSSLNIIPTLSIYRLFNVSKQQKRRQHITTIIPTTAFFSNISSLSSSTSTTQHQQISVEEPYSVKTGIKTAALLGGTSFLLKKNKIHSFNKLLLLLFDTIVIKPSYNTILLQSRDMKCY